ncbi:MAG: FtsQ-type POTRA domain-containing protein [Clostridia bacterium]|nr:FtsQ-type POTRA domain-containing protein [Clostridia bacterium]
MAAKKVDIKRALKVNRVLWNLFYILLVVTVAVLCFLYVFLVRDITIIGNSRFTADDLIRLTGLAYKESMLLVDKDQITENLQSNPFIVVEDITRRWPCSVQITVRERNAVALSEHLGTYVLLDAEGIVLNCDAQVLRDQLCHVTGWTVESCTAGQLLGTASGSHLAAYSAVATQLERFNLYYQVRTIDVTDVLHITLTMRDGMLVRLGDAQDMTMKMTWLSQMLTELPADGYSGGTLDLSSGNSAAYRPEQE